MFGIICRLMPIKLGGPMALHREWVYQDAALTKSKDG
jgi:hypothetical protein